MAIVVVLLAVMPAIHRRACRTQARERVAARLEQLAL